MFNTVYYSYYRVSPSPFHHHHHHPTQHNYTTRTVTHTVTLISTSYSTLYRYSSHTNVVCPSGAWLENRPHSTPSIRLARNPKREIVQWIGIRTNKQTIEYSAEEFWILYLNNIQYPTFLQILIPHVMWSTQAVRDSIIDHTQCHLSALGRTRSA